MSKQSGNESEALPALHAARCPVGGAPWLAAVVGDPRDFVIAGDQGTLERKQRGSVRPRSRVWRLKLTVTYGVTQDTRVQSPLNDGGFKAHWMTYRVISMTYPAATVSMSTKFGTCAASFTPSHATGAAADSSGGGSPYTRRLRSLTACASASKGLKVAPFSGQPEGFLLVTHNIQ